MYVCHESRWHRFRGSLLVVENYCTSKWFNQKREKKTFEFSSSYGSYVA